MNRFSRFAAAAVLLVLTVQLQAAEPDWTSAPEPTWQERYLMLGRDTYERVCAACHEKGVDGAPITGDAKSWIGRSPLWSAVLLDHAKDGYFAMPARGGDETLSNREVEAAGEYMFSVTFPDYPKD